MQYIAVFKHNFLDVKIQPVNIQRVCWPLIVGKKLTAVGGNLDMQTLPYQQVHRLAGLDFRNTCAHAL